MKTEKLTIDQAMAAGKLLPWALVRSYSRVSLGPAPAEIDPKELLEARFFGRGTEIRLFRYEGALSAVQLTEEAGDDILTERFQLENKRFGKTVAIHHILDADEDGQTYRAASLLAGWEEAEA